MSDTSTGATRAAILAVGSELLGETRLDTNSLTITATLNALGIELVYKGVVGDDRIELAAQLRAALDRATLVIVTGGLGPTDDDLTREVVADVLGLELREDAESLARIAERFATRGLTMPAVNRRQAQVPEGATVLANAQGTAPGLWIEADGRAIALLPGPPREMKPMLEALAEGRLRARSAGQQLRRRVLKIAGRTESRVEELTQPTYSSWLTRTPPIQTTILAAPAQIELHLSARGPDAAALDAVLSGAVDELRPALGADLVSTDGRTLEAVVGDLLVERGWHLAVAESCTGGLTTSRLTDVAGSSRYVDRSVVVYSNAAKTELLDVPATLIEAHGAVSEPVAVAMAQGMRARAGVEVGVAITGIAGPGGGTEAKPVGTVCIAVCAPEPVVRTFRFLGGRELVKAFSAHSAIDMVRRVLLGAPTDVDWLKRA